jgi:hypothetical protein
MRKIYWQIGSIASFLVINTFLAIEPANACSCEGSPDSLREAMKSSSRTFIGKVLSVEDAGIVPGDGSDRMVAKFAVSRVWKGKKQSRILVHTSKNDMCGSRFSEGDEYLVFSYAYENKEYASVCSKTSRLKNFDPAEIYTLGKGRIVR